VGALFVLIKTGLPVLHDHSPPQNQAWGGVLSTLHPLYTCRQIFSKDFHHPEEGLSLIAEGHGSGRAILPAAGNNWQELLSLCPAVITPGAGRPDAKRAGFCPALQQ
jgi:hypothetical protein